MLLSYQWKMFPSFTCSASNCQKLAVAKMLGQQKTVTFFNSWAFFNALSNTKELHMQNTKPLQSICCVHVWNYSILACNELAVGSIYKTCVKIKGVTWLLFSSLYVLCPERSQQKTLNWENHLWCLFRPSFEWSMEIEIGGKILLTNVTINIVTK
jgi:hypothetical protein